jgi:formylglycine-generating enzyme required for sulfatase activity
MMKTTCLFTLLFMTLLPAAVGRAVTIATVPVGNAGNPGDPQPGSEGSVAYSFEIGKFEVTNAEYAEFLNAVADADPLALYNTQMSTSPLGGIARSGLTGSYAYSVKSGMANMPVVFVGWYDAIRFANWLHNGQGGPSTTEVGAYTLLGGTRVPTNPRGITRNPSALWWLPDQNEWYKAAYHKNNGPTNQYWDYPTSTDTIPDSDQPPGTDAPNPSNTANFLRNDQTANGYNDGYAVTGSSSLSVSRNYLTEVGAYTFSSSPYGTFDQGGNVLEWNETLRSTTSATRGLRGGSWENSASCMEADCETIVGETEESDGIGFRVATSGGAAIVIPGDFNSDRVVDAADYVVWRKNDSGDVEGYNMWRANFGRTGAAAAAASANAPAAGQTGVPEPESLLLLLMAVLVSRCAVPPRAFQRL